MKTINIVILSIMGLIILFYLASFIIISGPNDLANAIIAGKPYKQCTVDSDCAIKSTTCQSCDCGDAVNVNWNRVCPFPTFARFQCKMCASPTLNFNISCVEGQCQKVWKPNPI